MSARYSVTTAYHPTPAPCDHCAAVAPLFRTAEEWVCAECHDWSPAEAARAAVELPPRPCVDCDPQAVQAPYAVATHAQVFVAPCHRCQRVVRSPWIMSTPADEYVPVCDDCAVVTR